MIQFLLKLFRPHQFTHNNKYFVGNFYFDRKLNYYFLRFKAKYFNYKQYYVSLIGYAFAWGHRRVYMTYCPFSETYKGGYVDTIPFRANKKRKRPHIADREAFKQRKQLEERQGLSSLL